MTIAIRPRALTLGLVASAAALLVSFPKARAQDAAAKTAETPRAKPEAARPDEPSFARDVAPILVANCVDCHSAGRPGARRGKLEMSSFQKLVAGGPGGPGAVAANLDESHVFLRVTGDEEPRMPLTNDATLGAKAIAAIEGWIKAGAKLDPGLDPKAPLKSYAASLEDVARARLETMAPDERDARLKEAGLDLWRKADPSLKPEMETTEHFALFSTLPGDRATATAKAMESELSTIRRALGVEATDWPGKVSLHVFPDRAAYVEFERTVKRREAAEDEEGDADLKAPQPYVVVVAPPEAGETAAVAPRRKSRRRRGGGTAASGTRSLPGLLTEHLVRAAVLASGKFPRWLAEGLGVYLAHGVDRGGGAYQDLRRAALGAFQRGWATQATDVLGGGEGVAPEEFRGVSFALVECLASPRYRSAFPAFLKGMREGGEKLDDVVRTVYGVNRETFLTETGEWIAASYGGRR